MAIYEVRINDVPSSFIVRVEIPDQYKDDEDEIKERAFQEALEQGAFDTRLFELGYYEEIEK
jgi:hypothetical protein